MALPLGLGDPQDDWRYRDSNNSSDSDAPLSFFTSPPRASNVNRLSTQSQSSSLNDVRASLHRRFTTNTVPTIQGLSPIGQQRRQAAESQSQDLSFSINHKVQLLEKKKAEYDYIKKKKEQFQQEMELLEQQAKRGEEEIKNLSNDVGQFQPGAGHQSEPTTPPEYREAGFPTALSRPNRFSSSSMISPPGLVTRNGRTNSQVNSPPNERALAYQALTGGMNDSHDESEAADRYDEGVLNFNQRSSTAHNRKSMPVTRRDHSRNGISDLSSILGSGLGSVDTTGYLFRNSDIDNSHEELASPSKIAPGYLQMHTTHDKFPILIRRDGETSTSNQKRLSTSDALDLASSPEPESSSGWPSFSKSTEEPHNGFPLPGSSGYATPTKAANPNRHSMGPRIGTYTEPKRTSMLPTPPEMPTQSSAEQAPKLQSSLSTSNVPTVGAIGSSSRPPSYQAPPASSGEHRLSNPFSPTSHRISSGNMVSNRHSKDASATEGKAEDTQTSYHNVSSSLHASAMPFGPGFTSPPPNYTAALVSDALSAPNMISTSNLNGMANLNNLNNMNASSQLSGINSLSHLNTVNSMPSINPLGGVANALPPFQNQTTLGYGQQSSSYQMLNAMNAMNLNAIPHPQQYQWSNPQVHPQAAGGYGNLFSQYGQTRAYQDSQARVVQQRRSQAGEEAAKFANIDLKDLEGEIFNLCKDQHGCRYLQKKLDDRKPESLALIFGETKMHMVELMTDPFGNYLCQKLLEYANDEQRTALINNAAPHMVKIALNQHGTRALQKMIEYVSTPEQIQTVIMALRDQVVLMIQDLNGNHVIQKCLNRLTSEDAQFIFDAVAANCVVVGTHRHGCCVIQRCIDHASGPQKVQLVAAITSCSMPLVQDPFGNYVLQYIFDQGDDAFSQPLCRTFLGNIVLLSKQKFSSNVIEKCIRIADNDTKHHMILEIIQAPDFERLVDDSFANYVVQTAWDYADDEDGSLLAEKIRPALPRMRHKPYGRRFQNRLAERDKRLGIDHSSGTMTPLDSTSPETAPLTSPGVASMSHASLQSPPPNNAFKTVSSPGSGGYVPPPQNVNLPPNFEAYGQQPQNNNRFGIMPGPSPHLGQFPQVQNGYGQHTSAQNQSYAQYNRMPGPYGMSQY